VSLDRCEVELGACLWHDTNIAALRFLENWRKPRGAYAGLHVLELGAGAGALGIALALDGARAVVTDVDGLVPLLDLNCRENGFGGSSSSSGAAAAAAAAAAATGAGGYLSTASQPKVAKAKKGKKPKKGRRDDDSFDEGGEGSGPGSDREDEDAAQPKRVTAKHRKAERAAKKAAKNDGTNGYAAGTCAAQAAEWLGEAQKPSLAAGAYDMVLVCDSLYENRDSWSHLSAILQRTPKDEGGEVVLASATLRRPFLKEFVADLVELGFELLAQEVTKQAEVVALKRPPPPPKADDQVAEAQLSDDDDATSHVDDATSHVDGSLS